MGGYNGDGARRAAAQAASGTGDDTPLGCVPPKRPRSERVQRRSSVALEQLPRKKYLLAVLADESSPATSAAQRPTRGRGALVQ